MTRYPDGTCYLCRQAPALPGDTCAKCGTVQPFAAEPTGGEKPWTMVGTQVFHTVKGKVLGHMSYRRNDGGDVDLRVVAEGGDLIFGADTPVPAGTSFVLKDCIALAAQHGGKS